MTDSPRKIPVLLGFVLSKHVPCAVLALFMLTGMVWLPGLLSGVPLLALLLSFVAVTLHMLTPALFALIFMGGGIRYALIVAALVSVGMMAISGMDVLVGLVAGLFYCVLPALAARNMSYVGGLSRSATQLAIGMFVAVMFALLWAGQSQELGLHAFVDELLAPMFGAVQQADTKVAGAALQQVRDIVSWTLPGLMVFSLWLTWWMNVLLARKVAMVYGFYEGDTDSLLQLRFGKILGLALMLSLVLANLGGGSVQYIAISLALLLAGALSIQGISVVHVWLKSRELQVVIVMMYILLFLWSMMVIPFILLGLLDIWFDYRRNVNPTIGGK
ncbi:MAG: DUF2232 domain-containing protein [Mariprofundaceae bacterium]